MSDTSQEIQTKFNQHMFDAVERLGLSVHATSVSVIDRGGLFDVRHRANYEHLKVLDAAAKEFADRFTPPLNINFV